MFTTAKVNNIEIIQNENVKVVVLVDVGGRMVFFGRPTSGNMLYSDSTLWNEPESDRISPDVYSPFKPYNGFITWVGPQSDWWVQQDLAPVKKKNKDLWPPDPFLIYSTFDVLEKNDSTLVIESPESPVSGVKLIKTFSLSGNSLFIEVEAINCRDEKLAWDLWSNARFDAFTKFRVPVEHRSDVNIQAENSSMLEIVAHQINDGVFTFLPEPPVDNKKRRISKAFIYPERGEITVFKLHGQLVIEFDKVPKEKIHPEQALVEVYNCVSANGETDLLELEHHSAYQEINPGENLTLTETWTLK
ncbi:MAG: DUF4380 domain-containing protein [Prolixibacteraceae bacterium]|nr:DUF4380 domain-containing protein [Prolixibacteraceae bacterium]